MAGLAHLDVVPEGGGWRYPTLRSRDSRRQYLWPGAIDDKGPAVASLYALKAVRDANLSLRKRVRVIFGCSEETGGPDVEHYLEQETPPVSGFTPDANFPYIYSEKGIISLDLAETLQLNRRGISGS